MYARMSFNSRTRVGATGAHKPDGRRTIGFNSRTRVGATFKRVADMRWNDVSIHAPVWVRLLTRFA